MNSSISSSDSAAATQWGRWVALYAGMLVGGIIALYALIIVSDPFSTGRFTPFQTVDIAFSGRVEANAGRVRDPAFDSAILGNSVSTRFQPELLNKLTDRRFVQLSIPGLGPVNELTLARAFARGQDERAKTFVFMIETFWCATDEHNMFHYPNFPNWLYEEDDLTYLREMFSIDSAQAALHRLAIRLGLAPEAARRDGYVPREGQPDRAATLAHVKRPTDAPAKPWTFFAIERLENFRQIIDPRIELVLLLMPFHVSALPEPGSAAQEWLEACKTRARAMAETRPRTIFIDRLRDDEIARDANNFWDAKHVRDPIIRKLENEIAAALRVARESERWKDSRLRTQPIQHDAAPVTRP